MFLNLGIGTTSPAAKLDVAGNIKTQHPWFAVSSTDCWRSGSAGWNEVIHNTTTGGNAGGWYNTSNGTFTGTYTIFGENMGNYDQSTGYSRLAYLTAGDTVKDVVYLSSAGTYMCGYHSVFQGALLYAL